MTAFDDFDDFVSLPRVTGLALSPDGRRLVAVVSELHDDGDRFVGALWELDPSGKGDAARLTRSAKGESAPVFAPDGTLLFVSARGDDDAKPGLWRLPAAGEAEPVLSRAGGVSGAVVAATSGRVVVSGPALPGAADEEADEQRRTARSKAGVTAALHRSTPVRYWDHDLGPDEVRLFAVEDGSARDLTPTPGRALDEATVAITPDGSTVITSWAVLDEPGMPRTRLVAIDTATGEHRVLVDEPGVDAGSPAVSRDGARLVYVRQRHTGYDDPPQVSLALLDLAGADAAPRELVTDPDLWPDAPVFGADGSSVFFTADQDGHRPVFRVDVDTDAVTRVTRTGHHTHLQVAPDGATLYALRDGIDTPPRPVRLDAAGADQDAVELPAPGGIALDGRVERVSTTVEDGTTVSGWLVLPQSASASDPAPLLLWIHGGPLGSWNGWSWRWNPWLMVAKGYAVLLPDPALSTGYGAAMIARGWGQWGGTPFTDLMAVTDAVVERPDIDAERTAAMGGSYGGYMANWVAGHTDRFRCIVTHASLWALDQFQGTTDVPGYWVKEWGVLADRPERYAQWSPHHFVRDISTPMLVIHGDKDYRVPIGEALRLWWDLQREGVESAYLYFPDEGHWILKPGNARTWYETVWAWLDQYVHKAAWVQPSLL